MLWTRRLVLSSCLLLLFIACAHTPKSQNDDITVQRMRAEFLLDHPNGQFNQYISKGEVVRGMTVLEVSAAWGLPETRRMSKDRKMEYWTYFSEDEISGDWSRYTLTFEETALADWHVVRHFSTNGELTSWSNSETSGAISNPSVSSTDMGSTKR
jgi:hypothetical protein